MPQMSIDRSRNSSKSRVSLLMRTSLTIPDVHILSQYRWGFQANQRFEMVSLAMCNVDSRSLTWEPHFYGARNGGRESAQDPVETDMLSV